MTLDQTKTVAIIGAGAAGLMAADRLSSLRPDLAICLYDAMPSPARKILMAGKSGLNVTHRLGWDAPKQFAARYGNAKDWISPMLAEFGARAVVDWMDGLGQPCFVGSSGRVFPKAMKASPLLRALMHRLAGRGVALATRHRWIGWDMDDRLVFDTPAGQKPVASDATLLTLGGPSWPRLGTDGGFVRPLQERGIALSAFRPANCGFDVSWPADFAAQWAGHPVKSVRLVFGDQSAMGDFVITQSGIEGGSVYALSTPLREAIEQDGSACLHVDLRPHQTLDQIINRLAQPRGKQSVSNHLRRKLNLTGLQAALLKTCTERAVMDDTQKLAEAIKALPIRLVRPRPIEEAISCAGGVGLAEINDQLMVMRQPGLFLAGEMLDWEAPTGGYLLTGCLSQGYRAAHGIASWLS